MGIRLLPKVCSSGWRRGPRPLLHRLMKIEDAAGNAYSRHKTGLRELEGDEDLLDYFYIWMNPNTATAKSRRRELMEDAESRKALRAMKDRLEGRFPGEVFWPAPRCP